jgi:hypothetical protein
MTTPTPSEVLKALQESKWCIGTLAPGMKHLFGFDIARMNTSMILIESTLAAFPESAAVVNRNVIEEAAEECDALSRSLDQRGIKFLRDKAFNVAVILRASINPVKNG